MVSLWQQFSQTWKHYSVNLDSRQFDNKWRDVYTHPMIADLNWYLVVGNHDYGRDLGEEWNQVMTSHHTRRMSMRPNSNQT